jgi:hypothetical protein
MVRRPSSDHVAKCIRMRLLYVHRYITAPENCDTGWEVFLKKFSEPGFY